MNNIPTTYQKIKCHTGNTKIYTEPNGGTLYIGGWNNGASFDWNTHVIDLTGNEHKYWDIPVPFDEASKAFMPFLTQAYAGWLSLPFPDYKTPQGLSTKEQWIGITNVIQDILKKGTDVLVACTGGHGRSGLFCAIVGYMLNIKTDRSWSSPVEKIRKIHCYEAVETLAQEQYVYNILGLKIQIKHVYTQDTVWTSGLYNYKKCPICGTQSMYIDSYGMCLGCQTKYDKLAPKRRDLTLKDIEHKGEVDHACTEERCMGIWRAQDCNHVVHNMLVIDGLCEVCAEKREQEIAFAEGRLDEGDEACCICDKASGYSMRYGVCYDCAEKLGTNGDVDAVHNTITDPYRAVAHSCDSVSCVGVVMADTCGHVLHNREVEDGLCPACQEEKRKE